MPKPLCRGCCWLLYQETVAIRFRYHHRGREQGQGRDPESPSAAEHPRRAHRDGAAALPERYRPGHPGVHRRKGTGDVGGDRHRPLGPPFGAARRGGFALDAVQLGAQIGHVRASASCRTCASGNGHCAVGISTIAVTSTCPCVASCRRQFRWARTSGWAAAARATLAMTKAVTDAGELAADLFVTPNTLKTHLRAIYRKLGAESRDEAVIRA